MFFFINKFYFNFMNRIEEFKSHLAPTKERTFSYKNKFYDSIIEQINSYKEKIISIKNYSPLLSLEQEINSIKKESLLDKIEVSCNSDESMHYEGIKQIINLRITKLLLKIQKKKKTLLSFSIELEPEKPSKSLEQHNNTFELENIKMKEKYESSLLSVTKQRLKEIDVLQNLIKNTLMEQDERIDNVIKSTKEVKGNFLGSNEYFKKSVFLGRRMKRCLIVFLFCEAFVLLVIYFSRKLI
ncbi:hypothetical protein H312_02340 [Anncaliia algerae PRA339]|uniref:t-SNARE coiled-coil homology domain-containing protein n=1 Tax=Anncaliia algerae PRA339 TaxID=1288291 RepID=A0A059EZ95_9MICR|nr:hypothetical protein H312_02340 [Anncaliia algerae PRA339]